MSIPIKHVAVVSSDGAVIWKGAKSLKDSAGYALYGQDAISWLLALNSEMSNFCDMYLSRAQQAEAKVSLLEQANIAYAQQVAELIGRCGNLESRHD